MSDLEIIVGITGVGGKHWQEFDATSPGGLSFAGYLCRQESEWLGTLALTQVEEQERLELVAGMPKIHYPYQRDRHGQPQLVIPIPPRATDARFTVKLDGTCIIFYALCDEEGNVLEVIPRTRLQPVLKSSRWGDWNALLDKALPDRAPVELAVREQGVTLAFELWGYRNPHLVSYETPLALTLHTGLRHQRLLAFPRLTQIARRYDFSLVESIQVARPDAAGLATAYRAWQEKMEAANAAAGADRYVQEGAVLVISTARTACYYKCKPPSIEEIHWRADQSIGREVIWQALHKMREDGYDFADGQVEDQMAELEKDFQRPHVEQQEELIPRVWVEYVVELQKKEWLRGLVEESGLDPRDTPNLMRYLSQHYPRKEMRWVHRAVVELYGLG
jgi:hypothetical protein